LTSFSPAVYNKCLIGGLEHRGRGYQCLETEVSLHATTRSYGSQQAGFQPKNANNILLSVYGRPRQYSSWALYGEPTTDAENNTVIADRFCQLNFFFGLHHEDDPILRELLVASITARKTVRIGMVKNNRCTGVDCVLSDDFLSFDPTKRFKCFRLIHSTAISVAPLDKDFHPVKSVQNFSKFDHDLKEYYSDDGLRPKYLCMIPLHPNRRAFLLDI
jgi:hypothetical protein